MTDRIEEELAHLTRAVEDLHEVVVSHGKRLDAMERRVDVLMKRAAESETANTGGIILGDERPPHY